MYLCLVHSSNFAKQVMGMVRSGQVRLCSCRLVDCTCEIQRGTIFRNFVEFCCYCNFQYASVLYGSGRMRESRSRVRFGQAGVNLQKLDMELDKLQYFLQFPSVWGFFVTFLCIQHVIYHNDHQCRGSNFVKVGHESGQEWSYGMV